MTRLLRIWSISALMPAMLLCANPGIADDSRARDDSIDFDSVVRAAAAIPFEMPRGELLVEIGFARSAAGDQAAAQSLFVQGIKLVEHAADSVKEGHRKALINVHLALLQHRIGDQAAAQASFARALEVAKAIGDKNLKVDALQFLARTQAETGDFAAALHTTRFFSSRGSHLNCLVEIAKGQARARGDLDGGQRQPPPRSALLGYREKTRKEPTTEVVAYHELVLADVLGEIAMGQAKSGESGLACARKTIHDALGLVDRSLVYRRDVGAPALANIALVQAKLGDRVESQKSFDRALRAANERTGVSSAEIMANIALTRWRAGQTAEAKAVGRAASERSRSLYYHFRRLNDAITQAQLRIGDLEGAVQTARAACELGELDMSPETVRELIRAHAAATSPKKALAEWLKFGHSPLLKSTLCSTGRRPGRDRTTDPEAAGSTVGEFGMFLTALILLAAGQLPLSPRPTRSRCRFPGVVVDNSGPEPRSIGGECRRVARRRVCTWTVKADGPAWSCGGPTSLPASEGRTGVLVRARTDASGRFTLLVPAEVVAQRSRRHRWRSGRLRIEARKDGSPPFVANAPHRPGRRPAGSTSKWDRRFAPELTILGPDQKPVVAATVVPTRAGEIDPEPARYRLLTATTLADGRAVVPGLSQTALGEVRIEAPGFGTQIIQIPTLGRVPIPKLKNHQMRTA